MKEKWLMVSTFIEIGLIIAMFGIVVFNLNKLQDKTSMLEVKLENAEMYKASKLLNQSNKITGIYYDGILCAKLGGRTHAEVMETCSHEYLHYKDDGHFEK